MQTTPLSIEREIDGTAYEVEPAFVHLLGKPMVGQPSFRGGRKLVGDRAALDYGEHVVILAAGLVVIAAVPPIRLA